MKQAELILWLLLVCAWVPACVAPSVPATAMPQARSSLLFDPLPGTVNPDQLAIRAPWPTTPSLYHDGEVLRYRERLFDHQTNGLRFRDYLNRNFTLIREGRLRRPIDVNY